VNPDTLRECVRAELDEFGRVRNPDEAIGEMIDKAGALAFEGYYKNDAADAERIRNGWYWTGDLGYIDTDGFLYFAGRKGDWIRVDGENTSALMIEQVLRRHPAVIAAAAFGVPDPRSGDQVMAAVEVAGPESFDVREFAEFLTAQRDLGTKGMPRLLRVSANLPVTGSNKVLKRQLQEQAWRTDEAVYRWIGRGEPEYEPMTAADKKAWEAEFATYGRERLL
jgi:fatty-acyl-CoA synthase